MGDLQVPTIERYIEDTEGAEICSPVEDAYGVLHLVGASGSILKVENEGLQVWFSTGGQPSCLAFNGDDGAFLGDQAHQAILSPSEVDSGIEVKAVIKDYEGKPLLGPHSMVLSEANNCLYFTDSGPLGESTLSNPTGSVFTADLDAMTLKPLAYKCLAYPSGIAVSSDGKVIYVSETLQNRVLRFAQSQGGQHHASVFRRLGARLGPTCLAVSPNNFLYVARYDFKEQAENGLITILSPDGDQESELILPNAPEISGISFSHTQPNVLWVTELSTSACYRISLPSEFL
jgi:sugar lactone lactonase YvrE